MTEERKLELLYRNEQWMVQRGPGTEIYLVEVEETRPDDLEGGYYVEGWHLATADDSGRTDLLHLARKRWVDMDLLEPAARKAIELSGVTPNYDLDQGFAAARAHRAALYPTQDMATPEA